MGKVAVSDFYSPMVEVVPEFVLCDPARLSHVKVYESLAKSLPLGCNLI
jgi:hypothetical protein